MVNKYKVNKKILKTARDIGHCPCNLAEPCPCDSFLKDDICKCGAYKNISEEEE